MIKLKQEELGKLSIIGKGLFGAIYKVDDESAYKIYHPTILCSDGYRAKNPAIPQTKKKIKKFINKRDKITLTTLPLDYIVINGRVGGIKIPYYDGTTLKQLKNKDYKLKRDICYDLLNKHTELVENNIYPTDYHLDNVMYVDGKVQIIDLDDPLTHITRLPNPITKSNSNISLNKLFYNFFSDQEDTYGMKVELNLKKNKIKGNIYNKNFIDSFFDDKEKITSYILADYSSDIDTIKNLNRNKENRILFLIDKTKYDNNNLLKIIDYYYQNDLEIYDFVDYNNIDRYLSNFIVNDKQIEFNTDLCNKTI